MVFSSLVFLCIFLPVTFLLYCLIPSMKIRNGLLILVSLIFYAYGEPVYVLLILGSTVFNYIFGLLLGDDHKTSSYKKTVLVCAVILNLALLGVFKYADMILNTIGLKPLGLALPIGISFYTFQAMSYVIDIYRGKVKAQKKYFKVLLYISFFPQLIAGPIVKYYDIEKQISNRVLDGEEIAKGLRRFIIGLSKKVLISNVVAVAADAIFSLNTSQLNVCSAWIGGIAYMLQIYYDFSGYSDMAIGLGHMFGFTFQENFKHPYGAVSIQDFWRKWHISLSTWFKEYLYIPLGGNRKGRIRTWINRWIVFFFTGLWHGANWTFVLWGLYHGFFLFIEDLIVKKNSEKKTVTKKITGFLGHIYVLLVVCVGFVMFRADTVSYGIGMIGKMFAGFDFGASYMNLALQQCTPLFIFIVIVAVIGQFPWLNKIREYLHKNHIGMYKVMDGISYMIAVILLVLCMLSLSSGTYNPFIYFRF